MSLFDGLKRQLRTVIQWQNPTKESLFEQWQGDSDELKNASKLIISAGQGCIFVYQGQIKAILEKECLINLDTDNIPFWTTVSKFMQFFESEHKAQLYFYKRSKILNQKWGTQSPIKYQDPHYKFPVSLQAYGNYSYRISDPKAFFINVVGAGQDFNTQDFRNIMSSRLMQPLSDFLAENRYSYNDIDANSEEISLAIGIALREDFNKLGFELTDFRIEGTNFDTQTQKRINRIADLSAEAQAAKAAGLDYASMQQIEALRDAAKNEGGAAGIGVGLGAGMGMGQNMANHFNSTQPPTHNDSHQTTQKLIHLKQLYDASLISEDEYLTKKKQILDRI